MKVNPKLMTIFLALVAYMTYLLATQPDPYKYGQCPEGWHTVNVQTSCRENE